MFTPTLRLFELEYIRDKLKLGTDRDEFIAYMVDESLSNLIVTIHVLEEHEYEPAVGSCHVSLELMRDVNFNWND